MNYEDIIMKDMIGKARRWLDRRGYGYIEIGACVWWKEADCLCVVSNIGLCSDEDGDEQKHGPQISLVNVERDPDGCSSSAWPSDICSIDDVVRRVAR